MFDSCFFQATDGLIRYVGSSSPKTHEIFATFASFTREYLAYLKDGTKHDNAFLKMQSYGHFLAHKHFAFDLTSD